jgi:hypothetical protein
MALVDTQKKTTVLRMESGVLFGTLSTLWMLAAAVLDLSCFSDSGVVVLWGEEGP